MIQKAAFLIMMFMLSFTSPFCLASEPPFNTTARLYVSTDPVSLDPRVGGDRKSQLLIRELFEGLTRVGPTGAIELALASSYTVSPDGLIYTFTLRPSCWSNGAHVTAHDFVYAWKSVLNPTFQTSFAYGFFAIKNAKSARFGKASLEEVGIRALDEETLEVTLEHPAPYFLELTSNPLYSPLYKPAVEKDEHWAAKVGNEYVCNGPFILETRNPHKNILLRKNPLYLSEEKPQLDFLSFAIIQDPLDAYSLFTQGKLDWFGEPCGTVPLTVLPLLENEKKLIQHETTKLFLFFVGTHQKHLRSPLIRKAIATACNRHVLCSQALQNHETPSFSLLPSRLTLLDKPLFDDGNEEEAKQLFEAGLKEMGMSHEEYPDLVLTHWSDPTDEALARALQDQIQKALSISVKVESLSWPSFFKKITTGDTMDLCCANWYSWIFDPSYNLDSFKYANNGINSTHWQDDRYIALLELADGTVDSDMRSSLLREAEEVAMGNLPVIPLLNVSYKYAKAAGVEGESLSSNGIMELKGLHKNT